MSGGAPGTTGKCKDCGRMVRYATLGATGETVTVDPTPRDLLVGFIRDEPYRSVQTVKALIPHAKKCKARKR